jgi:hypoxanthine phosphoribosyltransferase
MNYSIDVMISEAAIRTRIAELADEISRDYAGQTLSLVCVLKGGVVFLTDLARKLTVDVEMDFMDVSSYGAGTESNGAVRIDKDLDQPITGKHVLLVEDILDTGRTLGKLLRHLSGQQPASIRVCTLLDKPERRIVNGVVPEYVGFTIPDKFVVGYGLDYAQKHRHLPYIGVVSFE